MEEEADAGAALEFVEFFAEPGHVFYGWLVGYRGGTGVKITWFSNSPDEIDAKVA